MRRSLLRPVPPLLLVALAVLSPLSLLSLSGCGKHYRTPEAADSQLAFGVSMAQRGLWNEAMFRFHAAERLEPGNPHVYNNLGVAYEAAGDFEKALQSYQKALKLAPESREAKANYARFVEFYQGFKPKTDKDKAAPATPFGSPGAPPLGVGSPVPAPAPPTASEPSRPSDQPADPGEPETTEPPPTRP
jgi:tetratricopeptide (TPR) repeat protein